MKHRLFLAIDVPDSCRSEITRLQDRLDKLNLPVIWEEPQKLHLTLHFLGPTPHEQVINLFPGLKKTVSAHPVFSLTPFFLETLYRRHERSLIYLGLQGDVELLKALHTSLSHLLSGSRLPAQNRFLPHITIGRLKRTDPVATKNYLDQINAVDISPLPAFLVDHVALYESLLSDAGSHYQKVGQYELQ